MFFLKNKLFNKPIIFFCALLAVFILWPTPTTFGVCSNFPCTPETDPALKCGDGYKETFENCDDGNLNIGDGCDDICLVEPSWVCATTTNNNSVCGRCGNEILESSYGEQCDYGKFGWAGATSPYNTVSCAPPYGGSCTHCNLSCQLRTIQGPRCGDGIIQSGSGEVCDDGNAVSNDGCNSSCTTIEAGYTCPIAGTACTPVCGDGIKAGAETCDQGGGNVANNDGCNSTCQTESGYNCVGVGAGSCATVCGDGIKTGTEICDDNNTTNNDGCSSSCTIIDPGYTCSGVGSGSCTTLCGDGIKVGTEMCDDNNTATETCAYGLNSCIICDSACRLAPGATSYCSDSIVNGPETCDYDTQPADRYLPVPHGGDGCSATCTEEPGWTCLTNTFGQNVCVFHCGNENVESNALFTEECDDGAVGKLNTATQQPTTSPFNGDKCAATTYGASCIWCDLECKQQTARGSYCGDGVWNETNENCDDGNLISGDGCSLCNIDFGYTCKGIYSVCAAKCGDNICVPGKESCVNCSNDCGICPIRRPGTALAHPENMFANFFEKLKSTFIRPKFLIEIPGLNMGEPETAAPAVPTPVQKTYDIGVPTNLSIGNQNYMFMVNTVNNGIVTFSIR